MKTQFITDQNGNKTAVILPMKVYEQLLREVEDKEDIRLIKKSLATKGPKVSLEEYMASRGI